MNKYLKRHNDGQVDWSTKGFEMLNGFQQMVTDGGVFTCRKRLGEVLEERGFICESPYEEYVLSGEGKNVWVYLNDEALEVVRNQVIYNGAMHYELGSDELCDLWEMIRKAWDADE